MRRMKVGTLLRENILGLAAQKNFLEIGLRVNRSNEKAIRFYESCGLKNSNRLPFRIKYY